MIVCSKKKSRYTFWDLCTRWKLVLAFLSMNAFFLCFGFGILTFWSLKCDEWNAGVRWHWNIWKTLISFYPCSFQPSWAPVLATWLRTAASRMVWMSLQPASATSITLSRWSRWNLWDISSSTICPLFGCAATVSSGPPVVASRLETSTKGVSATYNFFSFTHSLMCSPIFTWNDISISLVVATSFDIYRAHQGSSAGRHIVYKRNASVDQGKGGGIYAGAIVASISLHIHI